MLIRRPLMCATGNMESSICAGIYAALSLLVLGACSNTVAQGSSPASASGDPSSLFARIVPNDCHAPSNEDIAEVKSAVASFRMSVDRENEARALILLGELYERSGEYRLALPSLRSALPLAKDSRMRARVLTLTADALTQVGQSDVALTDATEALKISAKARDRAAVASAMRAQGEAVYRSSPKDSATYFEKALPLSQQANDLKAQAMILNDEGAALQDSGSSFDLYREALSIEDRIQDCREKEDTLANLATLELNRGQIHNALDHFNDAAILTSQVGDHTSEAEVLHQLGYFHWELGDLGQALTLFKQSLQIKNQAGDVESEAETLGAIAGVYRDAGLPSEALQTYQQVLPTVEHSKDLSWQVMILNNLGAVEADLHHSADARTYYNTAARLAPKAGDLTTPAYSAWGIGELEEADALPHYFQAVRMAREYELDDLEGEVDSSLMDHFRAHHQPNVAIFFGKRAVDRFQSLRRSMGVMSDDLTSSFLQKKSATYRTLAEILIDQGRLIEAQQVLDLLKIQQYSDYVGQQPSALGQPLTRSLREAPLETQFDGQLNHLAGLDKALHATENAKPRQMSTIARARSAFRIAQSKFNMFLEGLYRQLESLEGPPIAAENATGAESLLESLIAGDHRVAAVYTLEGTDHYSVMVVSHAGRFASSYSIAQGDLDAKCRQFLSLLKNRDANPAESAQELFKIIMGPIQRDLAATGAKTLVWYLDGSLRYIPIGALLNPQTQHYVLDDYSVVNFTPLTRTIGRTPELKGAEAIAMGVSRKYFDELGALANVREELNSVVSDPAVPKSHGVMPGTILVDGQFTRKAMEDDLKAQAVVHIATHFVLQAGNDDLSFLLLGGKDQDQAGFKYSMADFEKSRDLHLEGTKLLTLSACETGAANKRNLCFESSGTSVTVKKCEAVEADQRENGVVMESIGEVALEKGAESVISSLWSVDDMSTSFLMEDFYRRWVGSGGALGKAEALRQAELDLLHGKDMPQSDASRRGILTVESESGKKAASSGYAHPYYWAPFVLTGNWQ